MVVAKEQKTAVVVDMKYLGLKQHLEQIWKVKSNVVPVMIEALWAVTPRLKRVAPADSRYNYV